ncbi:hypothetical protein KBB27_03650 [Patescibacteria group bacterium]|nr:hypothetical protein [Patescibacteria group bacterium]
MPSSFPSRRRPLGSLYGRRPQISDEEVLTQLERSLKALRRVNDTLEKIRDVFEEGSYARPTV